ncbi:hypothetical protein [Dyadobacter frigoris]|uniref:Uncharacterized protein n=1 Tax=Dyadobacter frigoris TaxID=2576211 RepID=A0A4U6D6Z3_9BACT|nr:hypothetical protein [Dyadobacter frigoris]TKT93170.1 hypothetical protein FDK13_04765 [Dyadobacter frigoris]
MKTSGFLILFLTIIHSSSFAQNQEELFDDFIKRLSSDPAFQRERVMAYNYGKNVVWQKVRSATIEDEVIRIEPSQWKHIDFSKGQSSGPKPYEWVSQPAERYDTGRRIVQSGIGNDLYIVFEFIYQRAHFDKVNRKEQPSRWVLTSIKETIQ